MMTRYPAMLLLIVLPWVPHVAKGATTCTTTPSDLAFGSVSMNTQADTTTTVNIACSTGGLSLLATARVRMCLNIGAGINGGGQTNPRLMLNSFSDQLQFQIYRDAARSLIWGGCAVKSTRCKV